ncbi:DciA family protein [Denitromonas iodatirespirans]|uniref:DUF721 domain-containing protein n=1 Tax=Denitromonas iodatirespirans TaxID=2795389 RepID=A0A944H8R4_DENI1|nr:DciA family protein [Denitromonas iodatirespirans]MBT0962484.1 DUF721 domain-containing protein [Denitromonas iodatirespirans]
MTQRLDRFAGDGTALDRLRAHAARLMQLQQIVLAELPPYLADSCHVANLKDDVLLIHAATGAVAAKLRQATPRLVNTLAMQGVRISSIKIATRPVRPTPPPKPPTQRIVSTQAQDALRSLADHLPDDDPLRKALERFVRRSRSEPPAGQR